MLNYAGEAGNGYSTAPLAAATGKA